MKKDKPQQLVYILTNPWMPDLIKIGRTDTTIEQRVKELSSPAGVPTKFVCYCCCVVKDNKDIERRLHDGLGGRRANLRREFFEMLPEQAQTLLIGYASKVLISDGHKVTASRKKQSPVKDGPKKGHLTFPMLGIKKKSKLTFFNDETKIAIVTGDSEIEFNGVKGTMTHHAKKILKKDSLQGSRHWKYKGEILTDMREKIENENEIPEPKKKGSSRSTKFSFSMVNIENGARLTFLKDETKIATVIDAEKGKIMFDGEPGTLSGLAQSILNKKALQGSKYWKYKGEILTDLREKMENKNK